MHSSEANLHKGALDAPDPAAVERGLPNLAKHVENIGHFCEPPVVALNRFAGDTDEEIEVVRGFCGRRPGDPNGRGEPCSRPGSSAG